MNTRIEPFHSDLQKQVKDFVLDVWKEFGLFYMPEYDSDLDNPEKFYIKTGGMFYVLKEEDKIIGTIGIINKRDHIAEFKRFYINKNYRGKGCGTMLFNKAIDYCLKNDFKKVKFATGKAFKQGHKFYKNKGFKVVKENDEDYYMEKF